MNQPFTAGGTVAQTFRTARAAHDAIARLRAAGFTDVRLSERAGETSEMHVAPERGLTEFDFEESLRTSGFDAAQAHTIAREVGEGCGLVTIIAGDRSADALAVLHGKHINAPMLEPAQPLVNEPQTIPVQREELVVEREGAETIR